MAGNLPEPSGELPSVLRVAKFSLRRTGDKQHCLDGLRDHIKPFPHSKSGPPAPRPPWVLDGLSARPFCLRHLFPEDHGQTPSTQQLQRPRSGCGVVLGPGLILEAILPIPGCREADTADGCPRQKYRPSNGFVDSGQPGPRHYLPLDGGP